MVASQHDGTRSVGGGGDGGGGGGGGGGGDTFGATFANRYSRPLCNHGALWRRVPRHYKHTCESPCVSSSETNGSLVVITRGTR